MTFETTRQRIPTSWGAIDIGASTDNLFTHRLLVVKIDSAPDFYRLLNVNSGSRVHISPQIQDLKQLNLSVTPMAALNTSLPQTLAHAIIGWLIKLEALWPLRLSCLDHTTKTGWIHL
jgi:hypothetical protein